MSILSSHLLMSKRDLVETAGLSCFRVAQSLPFGWYLMTVLWHYLLFVSQISLFYHFCGRLTLKKGYSYYVFIEIMHQSESRWIFLFPYLSCFWFFWSVVSLTKSNSGVQIRWNLRTSNSRIRIFLSILQILSHNCYCLLSDSQRASILKG